MRYYRNYGAKNINLAPIDDLVKVLPTQEQTGKIVTFDSPFAGLPLKSCKVNIPVTQEGTGDPSPDNVRNFVGFDSLDFSATGKNLWGGECMLHSFIQANIRNATVDEVNNTIEFWAYTMDAVQIVGVGQFKQNTRYTLILTIEKSNNATSTNLKILYSDGTTDYLWLPTSQAGVKQFFAVKTDPNKTFVGFIGTNQSSGTKIYCDECCVLEGDKTTDDFVPFGNNKLFTFGQKIYAGELDVLTGIFTATHKLVDLGTLTWNRYTNASKTYFRTASEIADSIKSSSVNITHGLSCSSYIEGAWTNVIDHSGYENQFTLGWRLHSYIGIYDPSKAEMTAEDFKTAMTGIYLLYPLATPEVIYLGGMNIETLQGENNLFASTGETTVRYFKK